MKKLIKVINEHLNLDYPKVKPKLSYTIEEEGRWILGAINLRFLLNGVLVDYPLTSVSITSNSSSKKEVKDMLYKVFTYTQLFEESHLRLSTILSGKVEEGLAKKVELNLNKPCVS